METYHFSQKHTHAKCQVLTMIYDTFAYEIGIAFLTCIT